MELFRRGLILGSGARSTFRRRSRPVSLVPTDFLSPSIYADGIPHFELGELRREHPVVWVEEPATETFAGGRGFWLVLNHADVSHVSRHPEDFSSSRGTSFLRDQRPRDVA